MKKKILIALSLFLVFSLFPIAFAKPESNPNFPTRDEVSTWLDSLEEEILSTIGDIPTYDEIIDEILNKLDGLEEWLEELDEQVISNEGDIEGLNERVSNLEKYDAYYEYEYEDVDMKAQASSEGIQVTEWLENYLENKDNNGWKLYYVEHIPLGSGDRHNFERHVLYGNDTNTWEYLVEQVDWRSETIPFDYLENYLNDKEANGWELLAVNRVNWTPGIHWGVGDIFYFRK